MGRHEGPDPATADQCNLLSGREQVPLIVCTPKLVPHPSFDTSLKISRAHLSVVVDLEEHFLYMVITLAEEGVTWG